LPFNALFVWLKIKMIINMSLLLYQQLK
jgi:hypothetical protein